MKAATFDGSRDIAVGVRLDPVIREPSDAVVRVTLARVCGSDLWYYRGLSPHDRGAIGHEFIGVVDEVGPDVRALRPGDFVVTPFTFSDGTCVLCRAGWPSNCLHGGGYGNHGFDGGQGEAVRVPFADATLVRIPGTGHSDETLRSTLAWASGDRSRFYPYVPPRSSTSEAPEAESAQGDHGPPGTTTLLARGVIDAA